MGGRRGTKVDCKANNRGGGNRCLRLFSKEGTHNRRGRYRQSWHFARGTRRSKCQVLVHSGSRSGEGEGQTQREDKGARRHEGLEAKKEEEKMSNVHSRICGNNEGRGLGASRGK